ncbi:MAG: hypothetical protein M1828_002238 [Chrysothrix sp. TS-e1954]|nr:MAG: hypothetical protein M1828_002238 [Chrysothrix sp. TS-e1954]
MSKSVVRSVKNVTKGYSSVQVKVRNATSNDAWGPTGTEMQEIAQMTYNSSGDFYEIMDMLDKRMNDKGKNWRHVLKSLKVLDYCLHEGSELVVTWARKNIFIIKTLREFQHVDDDGRDVGQNVRVSAKELTALVLDEDRLRAERRDRKSWKTRVTGLEDYGSSGGFEGGSDRPPPQQRPRRNQRPQREDESDLEYRLAIEASKNEMEEDAKRRQQRGGNDGDDEDLAKAIKLSKEEEDLRRRELEDSNNSLLIDDTPAQSQPTGYNQGYQQQGAVDWSGNPVDQQQPQSTGYLNNLYGQPTGVQNQQTGFQNGYGYNNPYQQPQQTGFDQSQYQQQQPQQSYMQPQQTAFNMNNPYSQQSNGFGNQNQQQPQQDESLRPGSQNPWSQQNNSADNLKPQSTGSNNPFAATSRPQHTQSAQRAPTLSTLQEQRTQTQFNSPFSTYSQQQQQQPHQQPQQQAQQQPTRDQDPHHANLNALLGSGEGQDTFGNVGNLRIPAQHTAPGHFVNSAGSNLNQLNPSMTGNNPFMHSQYTGMPQQQQPAQTGPVGGFGKPFGSGNPFGSAPPGQGQQQQQQQQQGGGSLIDL